MNNYIQLIVKGNPDSNNGENVIARFNEPSFTSDLSEYIGLGNNQYYFAIKSMPNGVVYALLHNNVRSNGGRNGLLNIFIFVPKGYTFTNSVNPYDVLIALKDSFIYQAMISEGGNTYRYKPAAEIPSNLLDTVAQKYPLKKEQGVYRTMQGSEPLYLQLSEQKSKLLLQDVQYREFEQYKDVVLAEHMNHPTPLSLPVPRQPEYKIIVDDKEQPSLVINNNLPLSYQRNGNDRYYDFPKVEFTIQDLLNGKHIPNVQLDATNETITVQTTQKPKTKKYYINFIFIDGKTNPISFSTQYFKCILDGKSIDITSEANAYYITLSGEQIGRINDVVVILDENYNKIKQELQNDMIIVTVKKKEKEKPNPPAIKEDGTVKFAVTLKLPQKDGEQQVDNKPDSLKDVRLKITKEDNDITYNKWFNSIPKIGDKYTLDLKIPNIFVGKTVSVRVTNDKYEGNEVVEIKKDGNTQIYLSKKSFYKSFKKVIDPTSFISLAFLIGLLVGNVFIPPHPYGEIWEGIKNMFASSETTGENQQEEQNSQAITTATFSLSQADTMRINNMLQDIYNNKLKDPNLKFADVNEFYKEIKDSIGIFRGVNSTAVNAICDYHEVVQAIENQDIGKIDELVSRGRNLHIFAGVIVKKGQTNITINHMYNLKRISTGWIPSSESGFQDYDDTQKNNAINAFENAYNQNKITKFSDLRAQIPAPQSNGSGGGKNTNSASKNNTTTSNPFESTEEYSIDSIL